MHQYTPDSLAPLPHLTNNWSRKRLNCKESCFQLLIKLLRLKSRSLKLIFAVKPPLYRKLTDKKINQNKSHNSPQLVASNSMPMSSYSEPISFDSQFTPPIQYPSQTRSAQVFFPNNFNANELQIWNDQVKR